MDIPWVYWRLTFFYCYFCSCLFLSSNNQFLQNSQKIWKQLRRYFKLMAASKSFNLIKVHCTIKVHFSRCRLWYLPWNWIETSTFLKFNLSANSFFVFFFCLQFHNFNWVIKLWLMWCNSFCNGITFTAPSIDRYPWIPSWAHLTEFHAEEDAFESPARYHLLLQWKSLRDTVSLQ